MSAHCGTRNDSGERLRVPQAEVLHSPLTNETANTTMNFTHQGQNPSPNGQHINTLAELASDSIRAKRVLDYARVDERPITGPSGADWAYVARNADFVLRGTDSLGVEQYRHDGDSFQVRAYSEARRTIGESPHHEADLSAREFRDHVGERALTIHDADAWDVDLRAVFHEAKVQRWEDDNLVTDGGSVVTHDPHPAADLTFFQVNILAVLDRGADYGLGIKRSLEEFYGEEVLHGRLYPNLDTLVGEKMVSKRQLDRRTNEYELTPFGESTIETYRAFLAPAGGDAE